MAKKKRSELFREKKAREEKYKHKMTNRNSRSRQRKAKKRRKNSSVFVFIGILLLIFIFYQSRARKPERAIDQATKAIKSADLSKQEKTFDRLSNINEILKTAYSEDDKEGQEFLQANYSNLDIKIKSQEKTDHGLMVVVEVSNNNFLDTLDSIDEDDKNFHRSYMRALEKEDKKANKKEGKLLLKRKFLGYKIYEDRDFVDGILGGALEENNK